MIIALDSTFAFRPIIKNLLKKNKKKKKLFTGKLDTETKKLMNKPRCGVPDRVRPGSSSSRQKRFALQGRNMQ
jgi:hypothetical protein